MKKMVAHRLFVVSICLLQVFVASRSVFPQDLASEFLELAPKGWNKLEQAYRNVKGIAEVSEFSGKELLQTYTIDFMISGDSQRVVHTKKSGRKVVFCRSEKMKYAFALSDHVGRQKYLLSKLHEFQGDWIPYASSVDQAVISNMLLHYIYAPWTFEEYSLPQMVKEGGFKVLQASPVEGEDDCVRVEFSFRSQQPGLLGNLDGNALFSKKNHWALVQFEAEVSGGGIGGISCEIDYFDDSPGDVFFPKRVVQKLWSGKPKMSEEGTNSICEFKNVEEYAASPQEFSLTAFGIPEPEVHKDDSWLNGGLLAIAGMILIVGGVLLNRFLRH